MKNEIEEINQESYLIKRLQDQINWYEKKSMYNHKWYNRLQVIAIMASASIPFISGYIMNDLMILKIAVGLLGLIVAVITAILWLYKFQENWIQYRTTCESLKHEKFLFLTKSAPYDQDKAFNLLVGRVESLISKENTAWNNYMKKEKDA